MPVERCAQLRRHGLTWREIVEAVTRKDGRHFNTEAVMKRTLPYMREKGWTAGDLEKKS